MAVNPLFDVDGVVRLVSLVWEEGAVVYYVSEGHRGFGGEGVKFLRWLNFGTSIFGRNFQTPSWLAYVKVVQPYCILKLIIAIGWGQFSYEIISGGVYSYGKYKVTKFSCKHSLLEHSKRSLSKRRHFCDTTTSFLMKKLGNVSSFLR